MPVKIRDLKDKKVGNKNEIILAFLRRRHLFAYTIRELGKELEMKPKNLSARLSYLKSKGLLINESGYWYYKPQVQLKGKGVRNKTKKS